jgi:hypothetical protein
MSAIALVLAVDLLGQAQAVPFAPFTCAPIRPAAGARDARLAPEVPVSVVLSTPPGEGERFEALRLVPSGLAFPAWRLESSAFAAREPGEPRITLSGRAGEETLLVLRRSGVAGYALEGPFFWPSRPDTKLCEFRLRRTVRGTFGGQRTERASATWLDAAGDLGGGNWPACAPMERSGWECIGVPAERSGVLLVRAEPLIFGVATGGAAVAPVETIEMRRVEWGRLVEIVSRSTSDGGMPRVEVAFLKPRESAWRRASTRVLLTADPAVTAWPLTPLSFWVAGRGPAPAGVLEIKGSGIATTRIPVGLLDQGSAEIPFVINVSDPIEVRGRVETATGTKAPATVITVSEVLEDDEQGSVPADPRRERAERLRALTEVTADEDGRFTVPGLGSETYEMLAVHGAFGRTVVRLVPDGRPVVLRLSPPREVRGRVVRRGQLLAGVPVRAVPDLALIGSSRDPTAFIMPDGITGPDGRFAVALPPQGATELRIGREDLGMIRIRLQPVKELPLVTDVGDVELAGQVRLTVTVPGADGCDLHAAGPMETSGMSVVDAVQRSPGMRELLLPEAGKWLLTLTCGNREVMLDPPAVDIPAGMTEATVTLIVRQ